MQRTDDNEYSRIKQSFCFECLFNIVAVQNHWQSARMQISVNAWRRCIFLSMKSLFEWRLQADRRDTSWTENNFDFHHEKSKFCCIRLTTNKYSVERSQKVRKSVYWRHHLQIENFSRTFETLKNFVSHLLTKRYHDIFVENVFKISKRYFAPNSVSTFSN